MILSPESLQYIDVIFHSIGVLSFTMIHRTVNVPFRCDSGIGFPGIGTDNRSGRDFLTYQGLEGSCFYVIHHFCLKSTVSTEDPEYWMFLCSSTSLDSLIPDHFSFILPLTSDIGFIDIDRAGEYLRDILCECLPDDSKSSKNSFPFNRGPKRDPLAALFQQEPGDDFFSIDSWSDTMEADVV